METGRDASKRVFTFETDSVTEQRIESWKCHQRVCAGEGDQCMHDVDTNPIVGVSYLSSELFRNRIEALFALESHMFYALLVTTR